MTILILVNNDVWLYQLRRELIASLCEKNDVFCALPFGPMIPELRKIGGTYIPFEYQGRGKNPIADLGQFLRYVRLIRKIRPDAVLTYTIKPNVYGGLACRITKTMYIANVTGVALAVVNGGVFSMIATTLYAMGLKEAHCVFFQNAAQQEIFLRRRLVHGRTRLIPGSGVNPGEYRFVPYPPSGDRTRFLFVGRIMQVKGISELLEAIRKLRQSRQDVFLDIVGPYDEDYSQAIEQAVKEGLAEYHGFQTDVHPFYQTAHCVILPSYGEGMSNVLLEAAATGRPVITTRVPGCLETFEEGVTGFGCQPGDADSLVEAMEKFLARSWEEWAAMGEAGHRKMVREFDRKIVVDAYMEELEKIRLEGQRRGS